MGKIIKKKPANDDSMSGVSQQSYNISTPLRRSTRQSVHTSATKAQMLSTSTTPAKKESKNKDVFASPRQPLKQPKSARKDKVLQTVNREENLLDESMPELKDTPLKPTEGSAVKKGRGRPKSVRKTLGAGEALNESAAVTLNSPSQPQLDVTTDKGSAAKPGRGRPKSLINAFDTPKKPEPTVGAATKVEAESEEKTAVAEEPKAGIEPVKVEEHEQAAKQTPSKTGSAKRKSGNSNDRLSKQFKIEMPLDEEVKVEESLPLKQEEATTENVLEINGAGFSNIANNDEPPNEKEIPTKAVVPLVEAVHTEVELPMIEPVEKTVVDETKGEEELEGIIDEIIVQSTVESVDIDEPKGEAGLEGVIVEEIVKPTEPVEETIVDETKVVEQGLTIDPLMSVEEINVSAFDEEEHEKGLRMVDPNEIMEDYTEDQQSEEPAEIGEILEAEPEQALDTTFDMVTDDEQQETDPAEAVNHEARCLTIDLIDVPSPVAQAPVEPQQRPKKVNTIDLVTPATEKRVRSTGEDGEGKPTPAAKKVIDIDTPVISVQSRAPGENSILKNMSSATKNRMTRSAFLSGCNDSIYIHAEQLELKSCRKRSQSFCVEEPEKSVRKANRVQFYSPLNMEIDIATIDTRLQQSFIESTAGKRRKRSMSEPYLANDGSGAKKLAVRTKVPNFTAIHEQNFKKMESISEHLARKAERSKRILALSKSPVGTTTKVASEKPAPLQLGKSPVATVPVAHVAPLTKTVNTKPKLNTSVAPEKPKPVVFTATKPKAELPTTQAVKPNVTVSKMTDLKNISTVNTSMASRSFAANRDKTAQRLQSYKRMDGGGNGEVNKTKRVAAIKGVRSNRRFELQMQFREREAQGE